MRKSAVASVVGLVVVSLSVFSLVLADSTIGTNMSTTGTFKLTSASNSATAAMFQNASNYSVLTIDTINLIASASALGINAGGKVDTTFEVGGTASISGAITLSSGVFKPRADSSTAFRFQNAAGTYSVFTVDTTGKTASVSAKFGINAGTTTDTAFEVGGTASISGAITLATGTFLPQANSTTAFRFQNAAGTANVLTLDTTNSRLLIGKTGSSPLTTLEVGGTASISGVVTLGGGQIQPVANSTTAFRFQNAAGTANVITVDTTNTRVVIGKNNPPLTTLEIGGSASASGGFLAATNVVAGSTAASSSTIYAGEFVSTATTSILFGGTATSKGTCLQLKNTAGDNVYARVVGTTWTVSSIKCHQ